ncbi:protein abrupt isoform X10 [Procambarus clarkii]|uniref:protein abrupt isoform X10 n=1 Tax=Procambarus clarkii TaxID=6728 RepID=UPI001E671EF6|nr:protein abrupt-like isoform X10 [Procambarus clarkii]
MAEGLLSLSWNNHSSTFCHMLSSLRDMERYTDVTIACEGKFYSAHKLVLSTCSDYFLKMFERTPCKHPIIVVKDVECKDIEALLSYMYAGVVSVAQNDLTQLIKAAELLQIKGLAVPDEPPITSKKAAHVRSSTDDRSSPHPKRQRREENRSPSRSEGQSLRSNAPSPRSSPFSSKDSEYSQEQVATNRHHSKANQRIEQKQDQKLERRGDRTSTEQQSEQHTDQEVEQRVECRPVTKESPEAEAEVVDESVIKEEMVEGESEGELPESGFDYRALVSNLGVDGCGMTKDHSNPLSSPYNHPPDDQSFDSQAGPSGLQGWANLGESGETSSQGYCGDLNQELSMQVHPGPQHQQAHHLD